MAAILERIEPALKHDRANCWVHRHRTPATTYPQRRSIPHYPVVTPVFKDQELKQSPNITPFEEPSLKFTFNSNSLSNEELKSVTTRTYLSFCD